MVSTETDKALEYLQKFDNDIFAFAVFFFPHLLTSEIPDFQKELYALLPNSMRLAVASPRGHGKSTIMSVIYPLWLALFEKRKDICIISASENLAVEWLRKIKRELELNERIRDFFGDLKSDKWSETHIILNNKTQVQIRAKGAGGQIRGFRPDVVICDDIETDESVESEEQRKKLKNWLFKACLNTLLPNGQLVIIGTIIHPLSVLNDLLSVDNEWTKRKYQAYKDGKQEEGNELWGALWGHKRLQERKKEIGSWAFSAEYMNDPITDESAAIKESMIRYWKELPNQYSCVIAVDPAYSEEETADFKVATLVGIDQNSNRYLISYIRTHTPLGEFQDAIINMYLSNKGIITGLGIPSGGTEKSFFDSFLKKCEERKITPPVVELKNTFRTETGQAKRFKGARIISALQPLFEQGKYYIHSNHIEARDELLSITPNHLPRWDDIVDTMAYAEQIVQPIFFTKEEGITLHTEVNGSIDNYGWV